MSKQKFPVAICIPVHELTETTEALLVGAVKSVLDQVDYEPAGFFLVVPEGDEELVGKAVSFANSDHYLTGTNVMLGVIKHRASTSGIAHQLNGAIEFLKKEDSYWSLNVEYVTFLELDDELALDYLREMAAHAQAMPEVEGWLPLVASVTPERELLKYSNEALWIPKTEDVRPEGYLDAETAEVAPDLLVSGAMLKLSLFTNAGVDFKPSIEVTFVNEFYRRLVKRGSVLRGMGKVLYLHQERRPGSYLHELLAGENKLSAEQLSEWFEVARREADYELERDLSAIVTGEPSAEVVK